METPSSTARRVTRSQTASNNIPVSTEKSVSKTRQRSSSSVADNNNNRCALVDISNDSPIVGVANGKVDIIETPLSSMAKKRVKKSTPGSGEALLRGQVKTLLQRVEEEAVISKLSMEITNPTFLLKLVNSNISSSCSPMSLLAPTPANTPQVPNLSDAGFALVSPPSCVVEEQLVSRVVNEIFEGKNENGESEKSVITRSLLLDFSDKSEVSECCSEVTQGTEDDGASSIWSIQVNASTHDEDEDDEEMGEEEVEEEEDYCEDNAEDDDVDGGLLLDELCAGLNNISVDENKQGCGKHTRFVYDSEDELIVEKVVECCAENAVMRLNGLPTPKGKHIRFPQEEEDNSSDF